MRRLLRATSVVSTILSLAILGPSVAAIGQPVTDYTQLVVRLNPKRDPGRPVYALSDCIVFEPCLSELTLKLVQMGGNPALIVGAKKERLPEVSGEESVYRFDAPAGESFCRALLMASSLVPSFGKSAQELKFSASKKAVLVTVRLPAGEAVPPRTWFDGILILLSVKDVGFADSSCSLKEQAQETACKGRCGKIRF
jgi:hypothetical protein